MTTTTESGVLRGEHLRPWQFVCDSYKTGAGAKVVHWQMGEAGFVIFRFTCLCGQIHHQPIGLVMLRMEQAWLKEQANGQSRSAA